MKALKIIGIIIAILVVVVVALPFVLNVNDFRPRIETELSAALGRQVKVGNLKLSILTGSVSADDLSIADDPAFSATPFVRAKALDVGVQVIPLIFSKSLQITNIALDEPQVILLRSNSGKWNFSTLGNKNAAQPAESSNPNLSVGKLTVKNGSLSMGTANSLVKPTVYQNVDVSVQDFSLTSQFPFTLSATLPGNGSLKLAGKAGPIDAADAAVTPVQAHIIIKKLDLAASGFMPPESGISGAADFDAQGAHVDLVDLVQEGQGQAAAREHEDDLLRHVFQRYPNELRSPLAEGHVCPNAAPVVVLPGPLGLAGDRDERVGLDLSSVRELLQAGRVGRRGHGTDEHFDFLSFHHLLIFRLHIFRLEEKEVRSRSQASLRAAPRAPSAAIPCPTSRPAARPAAARRGGPLGWKSRGRAQS